MERKCIFQCFPKENLLHNIKEVTINNDNVILRPLVGIIRDIFSRFSYKFIFSGCLDVTFMDSAALTFPDIHLIRLPKGEMIEWQ